MKLKLTKAQEESARLTRKYMDDPRFENGLDLTAALGALEKVEGKLRVARLTLENRRRPRRRRGSVR